MYHLYPQYPHIYTCPPHSPARCSALICDGAPPGSGACDGRPHMPDALPCVSTPLFLAPTHLTRERLLVALCRAKTEDDT